MEDKKEINIKDAFALLLIFAIFGGGSFACFYFYFDCGSTIEERVEYGFMLLLLGFHLLNLGVNLFSFSIKTMIKKEQPLYYLGRMNNEHYFISKKGFAYTLLSKDEYEPDCWYDCKTDEYEYCYVISKSSCSDPTPIMKHNFFTSMYGLLNENFINWYVGFFYLHVAFCIYMPFIKPTFIYAALFFGIPVTIYLVFDLIKKIHFKMNIGKGAADFRKFADLEELAKFKRGNKLVSLDQELQELEDLENELEEDNK